MHARIYAAYWMTGMSSALELVDRPRDRFPVEVRAGTTTGSAPVDVDEVLSFDPAATFAVFGGEIPEDMRVGCYESRRLPLAAWHETVARLRRERLH